jgi:signal transduction histidine kinase
VNQVVENTVSLVKSLLKKHMITAGLSLEAERSTFLASPQQIGQVLMNLINNAVEAINSVPGYFEGAHSAEQRGGTISIRTFNRDEEFLIEVRDTGPGIPESDLNRVFDPFFTSKKPMGMGVGLSICLGIVEDHQGKITAANAPGGGAAFTIALPMRHPTVGGSGAAAR